MHQWEHSVDQQLLFTFSSIEPYTPTVRINAGLRHLIIKLLPGCDNYRLQYIIPRGRLVLMSHKLFVKADEMLSLSSLHLRKDRCAPLWSECVAGEQLLLASSTSEFPQVPLQRMVVNWWPFPFSTSFQDYPDLLLSMEAFAVYLRYIILRYSALNQLFSKKVTI